MPSLKSGIWKQKTQYSMEKQREEEYIELDVGDKLWCNQCGLSTCPIFKKGAKREVLKLLEEHRQKSNNRVIVDIHDPIYRGVHLMIGISHVGCRSFSEEDISNKEFFEVYNDPNYLEID